ncbi:MAG TPA: PLDc N-terminal domain-containing protein [Marmoricola sp.]|nr:PLDc N-terminal domain-containing protein [Marmoricola sp.]HNJ77710.1 PLDc N-terminal domain-containing protein [Marmoricola sp.]HNN49080.1 PLDc N-terminal domain-containing protein [Marmoricola sp.]HNO40741.1 PLDc N-terminal domain-containing protein [Marmoricola sp.]
MPDYWSSIWDTLWWALTFIVMVAYLLALFSIITDLFRDRKLSGWAKAIWMIFLIFLPFITALAYLVFRGPGMAERSVAQQRQAQAAADDYIRSVAGGPAAEIAQAKALLDAGTISQAEFDAIKSKALAQG